MKKNTITLLCLLLAPMSQAVRADMASEQAGLSMTCEVSTSSTPLAPNFPVWLNVDVTNKSGAPFTGSYSSFPDNGMSATVSPIGNPNGAAQQGRVLSGFTTPFTFKAGGTKRFHVLLNELLPVVRAGTVSGQIIFPMDEDSNNKYVTLVAPFTVNVGPPLTQKQMQTASDLFVKNLESGDQDARDTAEREVAVLPDKYAVPILTRVTKDIPFAPWVVDDLGSRPRTLETTRALSDLAQSKNAAISSVAKRFLSQSVPRPGG